MRREIYDYFGVNEDIVQNKADADKLAHMIATQVLVWETVVGERDADFNHVDPGSADAVKSVYRTSPSAL